MGKPQSKPTQEEYNECVAKVEDFEDQLKQCNADDRNQMESKQTNVGIFSLGVENNYNGSSNCSCGFWGAFMCWQHSHCCPIWLHLIQMCDGVLRQASGDKGGKGAKEREVLHHQR